MDLKDIVGIIPELFLFVIPGYIAVRICERYKLEKRADTFDVILYCVLYSFIVGIAFSIISISCQKANNNLYLWINGDVPKQIIYLLLSVSLGLLLVKMPTTVIGKRVGEIFNRKLVPYPSVWIKAMENDHGVWATVYLKNGLIYTGMLKNYTTDPNETTQEILLTNYRLAVQKTDYAENPEQFCCVIDDHTADASAKVLIGRSEIVSIEINKGS